MAKQPSTELVPEDDWDDTEPDDTDEPDAPPTPVLAVRPAGREVKVFEVAFGDPDADEDAPYPFAFKFENLGTGHTEQHEFTAQAHPGAGGTLAASSLIRFDPNGRQMADLNAIMRFFQRVLVDGDYERLVELLERRDLTIEMDDLAAVFTWLMEEYTGRPLAQPSRSARSQRGVGQRSKGRRR